MTPQSNMAPFLLALYHMVRCGSHSLHPRVRCVPVPSPNGRGLLTERFVPSVLRCIPVRSPDTCASDGDPGSGDQPRAGSVFPQEGVDPTAYSHQQAHVVTLEAPFPWVRRRAMSLGLCC
jgi:hypothetical protein